MAVDDPRSWWEKILYPVAEAKGDPRWEAYEKFKRGEISLETYREIYYAAQDSEKRMVEGIAAIKKEAEEKRAKENPLADLLRPLNDTLKNVAFFVVVVALVYLFVIRAPRAAS